MEQTWSLVGCRHCKHLWIVTQQSLRENDRLICQSCGRAINTDLLRELESSPNREIIAEYRSRRLATKAGEAESYKECGDFKEQKQKVETEIEWVTDDSSLNLHPRKDIFSGEVDIPSPADWRSISHLSKPLAGGEIGADLVDEYLDRPIERRVQRKAKDGEAKYEDEAQDALDRHSESLPNEPFTPWSVPVYRTQHQLTPPDIVLDGSVTITDVWTELIHLADGGVLTTDIIREIRHLASDYSPSGFHEALLGQNIPGHIVGLAGRIARGDKDAALDLLHEISHLAGGDTRNEELIATATLLGAAELDTPQTIHVEIEDGFFDQKRSQRSDVLQLLNALAGWVTVEICGTRLKLGKLGVVHHEDLRDVSDCLNMVFPGPESESVADWVASLKEGQRKRELKILEELAETPTETASYSELYSMFQVDNSRVRQAVGELADANLVYKPEHNFGAASKMISLLTPGREVLEEVMDEIGRQQTLSELVSDDQKSDDRPCNPAQAREGEDGDGGHTPYRTSYLSATAHDATAACASSSAVSFLEDRSSSHEDVSSRYSRKVSYNEDRDEAVLSVYAASSLQYISSSAIALASPKFLDKALPADRLQEVLDDVPQAIIWTGRNIGDAPADVFDDAQLLRDNLVSWGESLEEDTTKLKNGDYQDRDEHRSRIMRSAHGLAGTVVHLLDLAGVDVVREIRAPTLSDYRRQELAKTIGISVAIQSAWRNFAAYRQLFETISGKPLFSPKVDAADPIGRLIGGIVLRTPAPNQYRSALARYVSHPGEIADDPAEFQVKVKLRGIGRHDWVRAMERTIRPKRLELTDPAADTIRSLVGTPHAAARALQHLGTEGLHREITARDVRYALAQLPEGDLLPGSSKGPRKIVATLLEAGDALSKANIARRAGICKQTVTNNSDLMATVGLISVRDGLFDLAINCDHVQSSYPTPTVDDTVLPMDVIESLCVSALTTSEYCSDSVFDVLSPPFDVRQLPKEITWLEPWVEIVCNLIQAPSKYPSPSTHRFGPQLEQTAIGS